MFTRQLQLISLALAIGAGSAAGQTQSSSGGSVALTSSLASLVETQDALADQFRRLGLAATGSAARTADRQAFARFVRSAVVPRLKSESFALFTTFDSLVGGGYAVPATLFDLEAINSLIKEIEQTADGADRIAFETRLFALSVTLDGYFTKVQQLVLPVLNKRLSRTSLSSVLTQVEAGSVTP